MKLTDEQQRAFDEFLAQAGDGTLPKMQASAFCLTVLDGRVDLLLAVQLGLALLLEKPLIILAMNGAWVPQRLIELADSVVRVDDPTTPEALEKLGAAYKAMVDKLGKRPT